MNLSYQMVVLRLYDSIMLARAIFCLVSLSYSLPVLAEEFTLKNALDYLKEFGHIEPSKNRVGAGQSSKILRDFQAYAGLPQTGVLDRATVNLMESPRCGVKDDLVTKRFRSSYGKWQKKELTYRVVKYSTKMSNTAVDRICREAMDMWEGAADIKFTHQTSGRADIEILFGTRDHGDNKLSLGGRRCGWPFDGPGAKNTVLAHAFYPRVRGCKEEVAGDVHIDDDEAWSDTFNVGVDLLHTLAHELGHSLGLGHSNGVKGAIMHSHHPGWTKDLKLHSNDVERIQRLYGKASTNPPPPPPPPSPPTPPTPPTPPPPPPPPSGDCVCDTFTRFDTRRNKLVGNCKTTYKGQSWCYIKKTTNCLDSKSSSSVDDFNWSRKACNNANPIPPVKPPTPPVKPPTPPIKPPTPPIKPPTPPIEPPTPPIKPPTPPIKPPTPPIKPPTPPIEPPTPTCVCDPFTRFDSRRKQDVGNCKTTFGGQKWCYIKKTTDCPDSKSSSTVDNYNWSREACKN